MAIIVEITTANIINKVIKPDIEVETVIEALAWYVEKVLIPAKNFALSITAWNEFKAAAIDTGMKATTFKTRISEASIVELINCSCKNASYKITKVTTQVF